jgi:endonuclease YncB( thermonuclease family)
MRRLALIALLLPATASALEGAATVIDGNRLEIAGVTVRLAGIRAPGPGTLCRMGERSYDCGHIAAAALMDLVAGTTVRCRLEGEEPLAVCRDAHGFSINRNMVYTGWALADDPDLAPVEVEARAAGRGMWRGQEEAPF